MKKKLHFVFAVLTAMATQNLAAQVSTYKFNQGFGNYGAAHTGTFLGHNYQNDTAYNVNLPFGFDFNGNTYNNINVCSNGFLSFSPVNGNVHLPISDLTTQNVISALGHDLRSGLYVHANITVGSNTITGLSSLIGVNVGDSVFDQNGDFTTSYPKIIAINGNDIVVNANAQVNSSGYDLFINTGAIRQTVAGNTPTRVCEFEFQNYSRIDVFDESLDFKIRLYESFNSVEVVYGNTTIGNGLDTAEVGLKGASVSDFNSRTVFGTNTYITSQTSTLVTDGCVISPSKIPSAGLSYLWRPDCTVPGFSVTESQDTLCAGQSVTLTASAAMSYSLDGVDTTQQVVFLPLQDSIYTFKGEVFGCVTTVTLTYEIMPQPTINVTSSSSGICAGETATITATGAISYSLVNGNVFSSEIAVSPSSTTIYTVVGTGSIGCTDEKQITQVVNPLPDVQFEHSSETSCPGDMVTIKATGGNSYNWNTGAIGALLTITPQQTTSYTVTVSNGQCSTEETVVQNVEDCTGLTNAGETGDVAVYPNPFNQNFRIAGAGNNVSLEVLDITGKVLFTDNSEHGTIIVDTRLWSRGIYFLRIAEGQNTILKKVIKD